MNEREERTTAVVNLGAHHTTVWLLRDSGSSTAAALDVATTHTVPTPAALLEVRHSRLGEGNWQLLSSYLHKLVTGFALAVTYPTVLLTDPDDSAEFVAYVERWLRTTRVMPCKVQSAAEDAALSAVTHMPAALFAAVRHGVSDAALVVDLGYRVFRVAAVFDGVVAWQRVAGGCDGMAALLLACAGGAQGSHTRSSAEAEHTLSAAVLACLTTLRAKSATRVMATVSSSSGSSISSNDGAGEQDVGLHLADCVAALQETLLACIQLCRTHGLRDCLDYVVVDGGAAQSAPWRALLGHLLAQHLPTATLLYT